MLGTCLAQKVDDQTLQADFCCVLAPQGGAGAAAGSDSAAGAGGGLNPAMLASMLSGLGGAAAGGDAAVGGAPAGAGGNPGLEGLMGMFQNAMQMGGLGGFGQPAPVADPATAYAAQIQQLQVSGAR